MKGRHTFSPWLVYKVRPIRMSATLFVYWLPIIRPCHLMCLLCAPLAVNFSREAFPKCHGSVVSFLTEDPQARGREWGPYP